MSGLLRKLSGRMSEAMDRQNPGSEQVNKCTSELLLGPDWMANMELCDYVNENVEANGRDVIRSLKRRLQRGYNNNNSKVMILSLTALDGCVKNCGADFHQLASSMGIMEDLKKMWASMEVSSSKTRNPMSGGGGHGGGGASDVDYEVMDKILCLIAEWGNALGGGFLKTYNELRSMGAPFPDRGEAVAPPIATPPQRHETDADRMARANEEAIQQAIAEVESENQMLQQQMAAAAAAANDDRMAAGGQYGGMGAGGVDVASFQHHLGEAGDVGEHVYQGPGGDVVDGVPMTQQQAREGASGAGGATGIITNWEEESKIVANSIDLLTEMLASADPHDPAALSDELVQDLVTQCRQMQPRIIQLVESSEDESILVEALQMNDGIAKALSDYEIKLRSVSADATRSQPEPAAAPLCGLDVGYVPPPLVQPQEQGAISQISNADVVPQLVTTAAPPPPIFDLLTGDPLPPPITSGDSGSGNMELHASESTGNPFLMLAGAEAASDAAGTSVGWKTNETFQHDLEPAAALRDQPAQAGQPLPARSSKIELEEAAMSIEPQTQASPTQTAVSSPHLQAPRPLVAAGEGLGSSELQSDAPNDPFANERKVNRRESRAQSQSLLSASGDQGVRDDASVDAFWSGQLGATSAGGLRL